MERSLEILLNRALPLTFTVFNHIDDAAGERVVRVGGSGIFVAPFYAITARHVSRDSLRLDWRGERPPSSGYFETDFTSDLFQVLAPPPNPRYAVWEVDRTWESPCTDISLMQVSAEGGEAHEMQVQMPTGFFEWMTQPPPIDSEVVMVGYPQTQIAIAGGQMHTQAHLAVRTGRVREIYELRRDGGMLTFPCFLIDVPVDHGFSGGPVFFEDRLCGLVSSDALLEGGTYAATLWPLALLEYEYPDQGELGRKMKFGELLNSGVIRSIDWNAISQRVSKRTDDRGLVFAHIETPNL
jgi:hypothetical protein